MKKFIQSTDNATQENPIDSNFAELLLNNFNQNIMENPCNLVYENSSGQVILHKQFDDRPYLSNIIADHINKLIELKRNHKSSKEYISLYSKYIDKYFQEHISDKQNLIIIFKDLYLNNLFEEESSKILKNRFNSNIEKISSVG